MPFKMLLAYDGSESAQRGAAYILKLMDRNPEVKVTVLTVALPLANPHYIKSLDTLADIERASLHKAAEIQEKVKTMFEQAGHAMEAAVVLGEPAFVICRQALEGNYNLIVIGTRGRGQSRGVVMGGVCRKVVNSAPCPVTVVPPLSDAVVLDDREMI